MNLLYNYSRRINERRHIFTNKWHLRFSKFSEIFDCKNYIEDHNQHNQFLTDDILFENEKKFNNALNLMEKLEIWIIMLWENNFLILKTKKILLQNLNNFLSTQPAT